MVHPIHSPDSIFLFVEHLLYLFIEVRRGGREGGGRTLHYCSSLHCVDWPSGNNQLSQSVTSK